ncbi:dephospho-CoA kinase [Mycetocola zhadangensis]|uniref:Dephospho-CoA kinase n=1 Tax=Mycetocola zhadangensis TaxID=1164595 RepID=A0A3L7J761_9MICO|nr:dephospho-CoA kinase [Mycetocola zhadangensis]RLQ86195.1 dephospho-CoA kinase [Mycetocola zhadangensis]GGE89189.1 dephospho-CoA kinase [Mycetocola zhadangensis]
MFLVGLTGGIGSGKSTIARHLAGLGAVHIDADQLARDAVEPGTAALDLIRDAFGENVIAEDGRLNRAALGALVFSDPKALATLNGIVHPAVRALTEKRIAEATSKDPGAVIVYDVPLLAEAKLPRSYDLIVVAHADAGTRRERLVSLRGMSPEEADRRIGVQASDEERLALADVVIDTDGTLAETLRQANDLWAKLIEKSSDGPKGSNVSGGA